MLDHSESHNLTSAYYQTAIGRSSSLADSISSMPTLSTSLSLSLCHNRPDVSGVSPISSQEGHSKLGVPCCVNSTADPVSATETNLDQAFARLLVSSLSIMFPSFFFTDFHDKGHFRRGSTY